MKLKFSGRGIAFLSHFMAENDLRYYLNGIHFEPAPAEIGGGVLGAATNGHIVGMWHDKEGVCSREVIAKMPGELVKACRKGSRLELIDGNLCALDPNWAAKKAPSHPITMRYADPEWEIPGKYPDLQRVVGHPSEYKQGFDGGIDRRYFRVLAKAAKDGNELKDLYCAIRLAHHPEKGGALATFLNIPNAFAVVMPVLASAEDMQCEWLAAWKRLGDRQAAAKEAPLPAMPSDAEPPPGFTPVLIDGKRAGRYHS